MISTATRRSAAAAKTRSQLAVLRGEVTRVEPAGDGAVAGVVGQEGVEVAPPCQGAVEVGERGLSVRSVGVQVEVAPEVGERDAVGGGQNPVDVGSREVLALALAGRVLAVEEGREPVSNRLVRAAGEKRGDRVGCARRDVREAAEVDLPPVQLVGDLPEGGGRGAVFGSGPCPRRLGIGEREEGGRDPGVRDGRGGANRER